MDRRHLLLSGGALSAYLVFPNAGRLLADVLAPEGWRTFEVTTRVEVLKPSGATRVWLPAALLVKTPFQRTLANEFRAEGGGRQLSSAEQTGLES